MRRIFLIFILFLSSSNVFAQEKTDSLVRLLSATSARLKDIGGQSFRMIEGPARFLHNDTYLLCDSAVWNVEEDKIDAIGSVQIIQGNTILTSDRLRYLSDLGVAEFRGDLVKLEDKDGNILKTNYLDYFTEDSVAVFSRGASIKDKDGNIIESYEGVYESQNEKYIFNEDVKMYSDSLFFTTDSLIFKADINIAYFNGRTRAWNNNNFISSTGGWYDREREKLYFEGGVYAQSEDYELWSDIVLYSRNDSIIELEKNIQVLDSVNNFLVLSDKILYNEAEKSSEITKNPVIVGVSIEEEKVDSTFIAGDTILISRKRMYEIDSATIAKSQSRIEFVSTNVIDDLRSKNNPVDSSQTTQKVDKSILPPANDIDTLLSLHESATDTVGVASHDSLSYIPDVSDTLDIEETREPLDTTQVDFIKIYNNVKIFRSDIQVLTDSLLYTGLDSIVRLYGGPVIWNEITTQITADSMQFILENKQLEKGLFLSNAFVVSESPRSYFNQIKAPEMTAFFNGGELSRFDAIGGVSALLYLAEDSLVSAIIKKETKLMSSYLKNGEVEKVHNYEQSKTDAYSLGELSEDEEKLDGFELKDTRPKDRYGVSDRKIRESIRQQVKALPFFPHFLYSDRYFPNYISAILLEINQRKELVWKEYDREYEKVVDSILDINKIFETLPALEDSLLTINKGDSLGIKDSIDVEVEDIVIDKDSLQTDNVDVVDSLAKVDSVIRIDSTHIGHIHEEEVENNLSRKEIRAKKKEERIAKREERRFKKREARRIRNEKKYFKKREKQERKLSRKNNNN